MNSTAAPNFETDFRPDLRIAERPPLHPQEKAVIDGLAELQRLRAKTLPKPARPFIGEAVDPSVWFPSRWPVVRDLVLFSGGLSGVLYQAFTGGASDQPTLMVLSAAMMGLPAFLVRPVEAPTPSEK